MKTINVKCEDCPMQFIMEDTPQSRDVIRTGVGVVYESLIDGALIVKCNECSKHMVELCY
jgi:ribosomal protein S27E